MKKNLILLSLFLFQGLFVQAQGEKNEKIQALKVAFITQELELSSSEAQKFWPVYNDYDAALHRLNKKEYEEVKSKLKNEMASLTNEEAIILLDKLQNFREEEVRLKKEMEKKLSETLSPLRVLKLKKAEHEFKMKLLRKYREGKKRP